jgi:pyridoxine 4-dehydrogenase
VYLPARIQPGADPVSFFRSFDTLRQEGLFSALGASEISAPTLERVTAAGIAIAVIEVEISLWSYAADVRAVVAWSTANRVPVYAYSPLGKGFLTRAWATPEDVPPTSFQAHCPRFQGENFYENVKLVDALERVAGRRGLSTAQLAIAWVSALGPYVVPIPGSKSAERAKQNTEAAGIELSPAEMEEIDEIMRKFPPSGSRYPAAHSSALMQ